MQLFDLAEVQAIEQQVIDTYHLTRPNAKCYFIESVAQILYLAWLNDKSDNRIVMYCLPLIKSIMVSKHNLLSSQESCEVFQNCVVEVIEELGKYNPLKGRIYTYMVMMIFYKVYDLAKPSKYAVIPIEEYDEPYVQDAIFQFNDFLSFLQKMVETQGKTSGRILTSMIQILTSNHINIQKQSNLIDMICSKTKLPDILVRQYYFRLLERYFFSVLD
jgi:hypothetical protein